MQQNADTVQRRIIAGLGNPGKEYSRTRHNAGFNVVDRLAEKHGLKFTKMMNRAMVAMGNIAGQKVILVKPQTFMNDSGSSIGPIARYYKVEPQDVMVVYDDLDLSVAQLRMRKMGGSGGHNGMKSIITHLGTENFPRLRVGIGRPPGRMNPVDFVLEPFTRSDGDLMDETYDRAVIGLEKWLVEDIERVMNVVNLGEDKRKNDQERDNNPERTSS